MKKFSSFIGLHAENNNRTQVVSKKNSNLLLEIAIFFPGHSKPLRQVCFFDGKSKKNILFF